MTVAATIRKAGPTPGNGLATVFPFAFKVFASTDIQAIRTVIATGAQSVLVLNDPLGYTVALNVDQNANPGGSITYNPLGVPLPATQQLTIVSVVPQAQGTHIINGGAFFANNIEDAVDKAVINTQDLAAKVASSIQFPAADSAALNAILPAAASRVNSYVAFDGAGNVIASPGPTSQPVSVAMLPVVQAATLALGRTAFGLTDVSASLKLSQVIVGNAAVVDIGVPPALEVVGDALGALMGIAEFSASTAGGQLLMAKSRHAVLGSHTLVLNGDTLGLINFQGSDGTDFAQAAYILAQVDGAPGNNDMPGRLIFATSPDGTQVGVERMRIDSVGLVSVTGALTVNGATTTPTSATPQAATSGTFRDFTGIPSWVKRITVMVDGLSTSGTSNLALQIGDAGGIETAGYAGSAIQLVNSATPAGGSSTAGFPLTIAVGAANTFSGQFILNLLDAATNTWTLSGGMDNSGAAQAQIAFGSKSLSQTLDRVRLTTFGGTDTFDAGKVNIIYE